MKVLSYVKDRRNTDGRTTRRPARTSRKNIPRSKRLRERAHRRRAHLVLVQTEPDDIETELKHERPQQWWPRVRRS